MRNISDISKEEFETYVKNQKIGFQIIEEGLQQIREERKEWESLLNCWCEGCDEVVRCEHDDDAHHRASLCGKCSGEPSVHDENLYDRYKENN